MLQLKKKRILSATTKTQILKINLFSLLPPHFSHSSLPLRTLTDTATHKAWPLDLPSCPPNLTSCQSRDTKGQQLLSPQAAPGDPRQVSAVNSWGNCYHLCQWPGHRCVHISSFKDPWGGPTHHASQSHSGPFVGKKLPLSLLLSLSSSPLSDGCHLWQRWTRGRGSPWQVLWQVRLFHCVQYSLASYPSLHLAPHPKSPKSLLLHSFG